MHLYTATASMQDTSLTNADGDFLIVPQSGASLQVTSQPHICQLQKYSSPS